MVESSGSGEVLVIAESSPRKVSHRDAGKFRIAGVTRSVSVKNLCQL